jgi:hypothetical protein
VNRAAKMSLFRDLAIAMARWLVIGFLFILIGLPPLGGSSLLVAGRFVGHVNMNFGGGSPSSHREPENWYIFRFAGDSMPKWGLLAPRTFKYQKLDLEWIVNSAEGSATLDLDTRQYRSGDRSGPFTRDVLESWLLPNKTTDARALRNLDTVFRHIESAAAGTLPPVSHHGHYSPPRDPDSRDDLEAPLRWRVQQGYSGDSARCWIPLILWLCLGLYGGIRLRRKRLARLAMECQPAPPN